MASRPYSCENVSTEVNIRAVPSRKLKIVEGSFRKKEENAEQKQKFD